MKVKVGDKVRVKPSKEFFNFKRKQFEVAEVNDGFNYPVMITRKGDYFCFKHDELELVNEQIQ